MDDYTLVKEHGEVRGFWIRDSSFADDHCLLMGLCVKEGLPDALGEAFAGGRYRIVPNTVDDKGGCFVIVLAGTQETGPGCSNEATVPASEETDNTTTEADAAPKEKRPTTKRRIEVAAETTDKAKRALLSELQDGYVILSKKVTSPRRKSVTLEAPTVEAAIAKARKGTRKGLVLSDDITINRRHRRESFEVESRSETGAIQAIQPWMNPEDTIESVSLTELGQRRIFGLLRDPNRYEVIVIGPASITVTRVRKAKITAEICEKTDYAALAAAIAEDPDRQEGKHLRDILRDAGTVAVDSIVDELDSETVGSVELATLLVEIGDPKAVPILMKKLDRGDFFAYEEEEEEDIWAFVEQHPGTHPPVEMVQCALCGKASPVTELRGAVGKFFCVDRCWRRRGTVLKHGRGEGCRFFSAGMCTAGNGDVLCSLSGGHFETDCAVYAWFMRGERPF